MFVRTGGECRRFVTCAHGVRPRGRGLRGVRLGVLSLLALLAGELFPGRALACSTCSLGDTTLTAVGVVDKPYRNRLRLSLEERLGAHREGQGVTRLETRTLRSTLGVAWSPTDRLTLNTMLPVISQWVDAAGRPRQQYTGIGDLEVLVRGVLWRDRRFAARHILSLVGGIKTPTGPRLYDAQGYPYPEDEQPGSGSWDPIVGLSYGWYQPRVALFASASYRYPTPGRRGYRRGESLGTTVTAQYQPLRWLAVSLSAEVSWIAADQLRPGIDRANSGGMAVTLTPALTVSPAQRWLIRLAGQLHAFDRWNGVQQEDHAVILSTVVDLL